MSFTDTEENLALDSRYRQAGETYEVALHTASPGEIGDETNEIAVARQPVTFSASASGISRNEATLEFPNMPDDGTGKTTVAAISIHRVSTGAMISYGVLSTAKDVPAGETARIPGNGITLNME